MITFPLLLSVIAKMQNTICAFLLSCPVRGTWIEIKNLQKGREMMAVVPRTGHVDLNSTEKQLCLTCAASCPVRGTWIEMLAKLKATEEWQVVPRTGHVD